jgi:CubicO group peptidase (beta-lactamase class C family)
MPRTLLTLAGFLCTAAPLHAQGQAIDELARQTMAQWKVPGLALVVVQNDRLVYLKGFGVREAGKPGPVSPDTVFPIASCTKSFTTLAMGMLVDDGKMDWDDPVRKHVPYFHLSDPLADAAVTLRDLAAHRTGVGSHDLMWYQVPWNLEERIRRAGKLDLALPFRSSFRYQVVLFGAAGVAVGNASGSTWQDFVRRRILDPLEMKATTCTFPAGHPKLELASPHRKGPDGKVAAIDRYPLTEPDPAGSIHSTARDLARYLRFQLGDGTWQGQRLISAESLTEPHTPQVVLRREGAAKAMNPDTLFLHYGLGWVVQDYRGKLLVMHGGSIDGFRAHLTLVPEAGLGIGLLNNLDGGLANLALSNSLIDRFLGLPAKDWSSYYLELHEDGERQEQAHAKALRDKRGPDKGPPRPLSAYAGAYDDAAYGDCRIEVDDGRLVWNWAKVRCPLEHYEGDVFLANYGPLVDAAFVFTTGPGGAVESFRAVGRTFRRKSP